MIIAFGKDNPTGGTIEQSKKTPATMSARNPWPQRFFGHLDQYRTGAQVASRRLMSLPTSDGWRFRAAGLWMDLLGLDSAALTSSRRRRVESTAVAVFSHFGGRRFSSCRSAMKSGAAEGSERKLWYTQLYNGRSVKRFSGALCVT